MKEKQFPIFLEQKANYPQTTTGYKYQPFLLPRVISHEYVTEIWVNLNWLLWHRDWWCCLSGLWQRVDRMNLKSVGRLNHFVASPDFLIACSSSVWSCCCTRMMLSLCPFYVLNCIILCATSRITSQILKPKRWQVWPRANRVYCRALNAKEAPKKYNEPRMPHVSP